MARVKVRTGMPSVALDKAEFARRVRARFYDPAFEPVEQEIERSSRPPGTATTTAASRRAPSRPARATPIRATSSRSTGRSEPRPSSSAERRQKSKSAKSRILLINGSARSDQTCPGEMSKSFRLVKIAEQVFAARARFRGRAARPQPSHLGVRPQHPSLQGLRIDGHAALPLAVLLLSQPFAGPAQRLDERDLSHVGRRPRRHDRDTGQLVSGARRD